MTPEELLFQLERRILGARKYSTKQLVERSDIDRSVADELWAGLGFPPVEPYEAHFTDEDLEVLNDLAQLDELGITISEVLLPLSRVLGQALSRVASAEVEAFRPAIEKALDRAGEAETVDQAMLPLTDTFVSSFERFISYVWRRHLIAAISRELKHHGEVVETIGFADLVDFTRETRNLPEDDLTDLLVRFEQAALESITASGGRVIKVIGDGVMFAAPTEEAAAHAALAVVDACRADEGLLGVRVGIASGDTVALQGDLYGETVNRSSRLAGLARPDTVLADDVTGEALAAGGMFTVRRLRPHRLKGLGSVRAWVVREPAI